MNPTQYQVLFHIGNIPVRAYGTLIMIGFLLGVWRGLQVCARRMETEPEGSPRRVSPEVGMDFAISSLIVGLIGARLLFVAQDLGTYLRQPLEIFKIWAGGMSLHGSLLFGLLYMIYFCRRRKISFLAFGDLAAPTFALGYAIGRLGCLFNGCCYGGVCDLPWGMRFPDESAPGTLTPPSHPIQIYATILNLGFFAWLVWWERRPRRDGEMMFGYIAMYGGYRLFVEFFRAGVTSTYLIPALRLTETHLVSAAMILLGLYGIFWLRRHRPAYQDAAYAQPGQGFAGGTPRAVEAAQPQKAKGV